jgi:DNA-binding LacI/PurR family transcriptional regulator/anti-anti-sigma regulatory factor
MPKPKTQQKVKSDRSKPQQAQPTIAYVAPAIRGASQQQWTGVLEAAQQHNVNLICCPGNSPHSDRGFETQGSIIYDLISAENVDGVASWASSIGNFMPAEEITTFHENYRPLPVVTIGRNLEGMPGLLMDSYEGMREAMIHLIEVHGHRHVAFVSGPEGHFYAQERYRAYAETLEAYDIPIDPNLVTPSGIWGFDVGQEGMELLLNERHLRPGVDFTAVVGANDELILGAMAALQARDVKIPGEVAAIGFDDTTRGQTNTPPLSSVAPPFFDTGFMAVETLLTLLKDDQIPEEITVPSKLLTRQSCGCLLPAVAHVAANVDQIKDETLETALADRQKEMIEAMMAEVGGSAKTMAADWAERLLKSLAAELNNESSGIFLQELDDMLRQEINTNGDLTIWQETISALRRQALPYLSDETLLRAIDLWEQARVTIGEAAQRRQAYQGVQANDRAQALREIGAALITTFDLEDLVNVLAKRLPRLGIPSCYLALYENPQPYEYPQPAPEWSRLMLAYTDKGRVELNVEGQRFQSHELLPAELWPKKRQYSFVLEPLHFQDNQLGYILFEVGPRDGAIYNALRAEISSALKGALLLQERAEAEAALEKAYTEVEQQVQERTAELQHEIAEREQAQAESQRAQAESQRLQQEVIDSQKRAIQELSTPVIPVLDGIIIMPLIGSIDSLRARDITRALLAGITRHRAKVVILDMTGVPLVDSGVANHLHKTIQAARLKGAQTIMTGISEAVAETIVDLGIDWSSLETVSDLQTGLRTALAGLRKQI